MELTKLCYSPLDDGERYEILEDWLYEVNGYILKVPKGFITDSASSPRALWSLFPKFGKHTRAAIVHDYLYSAINDTGINRTLADKIFLFIMKECGVAWWRRKAMYKAVRTCGECFWKSKIRNEGYRDVAVIDRTEEALEYYNLWFDRIRIR